MLKISIYLIKAPQVKSFEVGWHKDLLLFSFCQVPPKENHSLILVLSPFLTFKNFQPITCSKRSN